MEFDCTKDGKNIYFVCREKAAKYNDLLNSRERAAELLGISTSTLANHELGVTKNIPPDTVVMMSDLYKTPELRSYYCKHESVQEDGHRNGITWKKNAVRGQGRDRKDFP